MFSFLRLDLRSVSESVLVFVICLAAVGAGAVSGHLVVSWLALGGFSGFVMKWLLALRQDWGVDLVVPLLFLAGLVGFYCVAEAFRALEAMG